MFDRHNGIRVISCKACAKEYFAKIDFLILTHRSSFIFFNKYFFKYVLTFLVDLYVRLSPVSQILLGSNSLKQLYLPCTLSLASSWIHSILFFINPSMKS